MSRACERPLENRELVDYWFEEHSTPDAERVEEHLFECDACGGRVRALAALGDGVRRLAHSGALQVTVTRAFLEAAAREGRRSREYVVRPGERVACTVTAEDDLLVSRMRADFTGVSQLDVLFRVEGQSEIRIPDVPVSPDAEELIMAQSLPRVHEMGRAIVHFRLVAREGGDDRVLGEYTFDHTPT